MPERHGLFQGADKPLLMRLGIASIYTRMQFQKFKTPLNSVDAAAHQLRVDFVQQQRLHMHEIASRLLDSLDLLQQHITCLDAHFNADDRPINHTGTSRRASMYADAVLQYLGMFLDAVGRTVPFVILDDPRKAPDIESLHHAAKAARMKGEYSAVKEVFSELDAPDSWWRLGFQRGFGLRQRITHYPDLIQFHGSGTVGGDMRARAFVHKGPKFGFASETEFTENISKILQGMCDWLDRLEAILIRVVVERAERVDAQLFEVPDGGIYLPVFMSGEFQGYRPDYLYLPLCADSAPIREGVTWRFGI
jgi:hypothetical protein